MQKKPGRQTQQGRGGGSSELDVGKEMPAQPPVHTSSWKWPSTEGDADVGRPLGEFGQRAGPVAAVARWPSRRFAAAAGSRRWRAPLLRRLQSTRAVFTRPSACAGLMPSEVLLAHAPYSRGGEPCCEKERVKKGGGRAPLPPKCRQITYHFSAARSMPARLRTRGLISVQRIICERDCFAPCFEARAKL